MGLLIRLALILVLIYIYIWVFGLKIKNLKHLNCEKIEIFLICYTWGLNQNFHVELNHSCDQIRSYKKEK
jgi:hypothetical protein